jgi:hypothetical protein
LPGEAEGVADEIGDVLDLRHLVGVGEDHRVALAAQAIDLLGECGNITRPSSGCRSCYRFEDEVHRMTS